MSYLLQFPLGFWTGLSLMGVFTVSAWRKRDSGIGLPILMVLGTVFVWYIADVFYNDYRMYRYMLGEESLDSAWWQFALFILAFGLTVPHVHYLVNRALIGQESRVMFLFRTHDLDDPRVQANITDAARKVFIAWFVLMLIALWRTNGDMLSLFFPYIRGVRSQPWGRGQIGGSFNAALASLGFYFQMFLVAAVGTIAAVSKDRKVRMIALLICCIQFPTYIFGRTRHIMITTILPGFLTWVFLRLRGSLVKKGLILGIAFLLVNNWFAAVLANRQGMMFDLRGALSFQREEGRQYHLGLNMFMELAWIDNALRSGTYAPNWGERYLAEIVNPIPRSIWKNKPKIGLDYAVARGQSVRSEKGEVTATMSTGMIGQGVVNFGRILGPVFAALLMSFWVAILARMDLMGEDPLRLLLYMLGMALTFNIGRDITLLVLYPFFFGWGLVLLITRYRHQKFMTRKVPGKNPALHRAYTPHHQHYRSPPHKHL